MGNDSLWETIYKVFDAARRLLRGLSRFGTLLGEREEDQGQYLFVRSLFNSVQVIRFACFTPIGWAYAFHQDNASSVRVPIANVTLFSSAHLLRENTDSVRFQSGPVFLLGLLAFAIVAACAFRAVVTLSATSFLMAFKNKHCYEGDEDENDAYDDDE
ncbi:hypothetical protein Tco_1522494 [Tanacetum coccineum]